MVTPKCNGIRIASAAAVLRRLSVTIADVAAVVVAAAVIVEIAVHVGVGVVLHMMQLLWD